MRSALSVVCALALGLIAPALAAQSVHYEGGLSVASGKYIYAERTTSWVLTNGLALSAGPVTIRAMLPVFRQNSVVVTVSSAGPIPTGGATSTSDTGTGGSGGRGWHPQVVGSHQVAVETDSLAVDSGELVTGVSGYELAVGDPSASMTIGLLRGAAVGISATLGAKAPVTGTDGFGTGEWDLGGSVSLSHRIGFTGLVSLDVGYWHLGDLPDLDLRDPLLGSLSFAYLSTAGWGLGMNASAASAVIAGYPNAYQVGLNINRVGRTGTLGVNIAVGLTDTTPDLTVGLSWRVGLTRPTW
ncbi:MAG: hypothetical protein JSW71_12830 [Gemmatimonadota bacterium]|nr:MAG: hypothetical protein JSW71_12830 [Gemmatimonadota bacterium]